MALAQYSGAQFFDQQGTCTMAINYDDVTLAVQSVTYANSCASPAAAVVTQNGTPHNFLVQPGTSGTVSITSLGLTMTSQVITRHGAPFTLISLPVGVDASFRFPA